MTTTGTDVPAFGTLAWARARGGRMSRWEQVREGALSTRTLGPLMAARAADRLGVPVRNGASLDADELTVPDSKIAREADEECRTTTSPLLYNHSVRTYFWGLMLAKRDGLDPDRELFFVASMLHDLTLDATHRDHARMACFAARGGILADEWSEARGLDVVRRATLSNAISLHLNARIDPSFGPEAVLLQAGAGVDTIGLRYRHLDPGSVTRVLKRYPRHDLKASLPQTFAHEAHAGTRTAFLKSIGFNRLVRTSQFAE
ncbi:HD domain-containing protein [Nocardioides humilatus]|nr:HD domain-containing protein [Nocardioides humilatus]